MPLLHLVVLAVLQGAAEALPVSPSGHAALARLWMTPSTSGAGLEAVLHLATALALGIAARRRLAVALGEGVRAVARPALFQASPGARDAVVLVVASAASVATASLVAPRVEALQGVPSAIGLGLLVVGVGLASTFWARRGWPGSGRVEGGPVADAPAIPLAALAGIAHGLAVFPGASRVGAALTVLLWLGVHAGRAIDLALLITVPSLLVAAAKGLTRDAALGGLDAGTVAVGLVLAFVATLVAGDALRSLGERRRLPFLALWIIPLGLAMLAYARALPTSGT
ncbi:MAG: undecaprenyl-diphosphate phosphatase [Byssovorax sp.]